MVGITPRPGSIPHCDLVTQGLEQFEPRTLTPDRARETAANILELLQRGDQAWIYRGQTRQVDRYINGPIDRNLGIKTLFLSVSFEYGMPGIISRVRAEMHDGCYRAQFTQSLRLGVPAPPKGDGRGSGIASPSPPKAGGGGPSTRAHRPNPPAPPFPAARAPDGRSRRLRFRTGS